MLEAALKGDSLKIDVNTANETVQQYMQAKKPTCRNENYQFGQIG